MNGHANNYDPILESTKENEKNEQSEKLVHVVLLFLIVAIKLTSL
jgi:hypothetical protein